jgi:hypothetical protein
MRYLPKFRAASMCQWSRRSPALGSVEESTQVEARCKRGFLLCRRRLLKRLCAVACPILGVLHHDYRLEVNSRMTWPSRTQPPKSHHTTVAHRNHVPHHNMSLHCLGRAILFGMRLTHGACAPSPLAGEGRDGGKPVFSASTVYTPTPTLPHRGGGLVLST